jgi:hypothetical protein
MFLPTDGTVMSERVEPVTVVWSYTELLAANYHIFKPLLIPIWIFAGAMLLITPFVPAQAFQAFTLPILLLVFFAVAFLPLVTRTSYSQMKKLHGDCIVALDPEHLVVNWTKSASEVRYGWRSIVKVVQTKNFIFLYVAKRIAIAIPKRVFATSNDAEHFLTLATNLWQRGLAKGHDVGTCGKSADEGQIGN